MDVIKNLYKNGVDLNLCLFIMSHTQNNREPAANQLLDYRKKIQGDKRPSATTTSGNPNPEKDASLTVGKTGPTLFQDYILIDELANFSRERIPERVVHAKGAGAFGYFEVTHDITKYSAAKVFAHVGKKTPIAIRFSQVAGEMGSADTVRDVRGFAVKFYTEDGIWDIVGNNTPIFFIRDAVLFPSFIHILKRNPVTHLRDWDMFWDMMSLRPETTHQLLIFYSDRGIPASYRKMHGYGSNTFALVNEHGTVNYCKFHYKSNQGISNLDPIEAAKIAGDDPDYLLRDLYNAIASGKYPSWSFYIQVMTTDQARASHFDPFDVTKIWPQMEYPLIPVGKLVLNRNQRNYFAEIEQLGFDPAHLIPGIEPSPDRMLQGRLFNYGDTHRYRLGKNHLQLPVNSPFQMHNFSRDGYMTFDNQGGAPNYHPNSFGGPDSDKRAQNLSPVLPISGDATRYDNGGEEWDNFGQAKSFYETVLDDGGRKRLVDNIVKDLKKAADFIQDRAVANFTKVNADFGRKIKSGLQTPRHADL